MTSKRELSDRITALEDSLHHIYDRLTHVDTVHDQTRRLLKTAEDVAKFWEARAKEREKERDTARSDLQLTTEQRDAFERQVIELRLPAPPAKRGRR